jgi:hypothetical protein
VLRIPIELVPRDALGSLVNKSQSTPYRVSITLSATATIYGTAPTSAPSVRIRMTPVSYWEPTPVDGSGNQVAPVPARPRHHAVLERHPVQRERRCDGRTAHILGGLPDPEPRVRAAGQHRQPDTGRGGLAGPVQAAVQSNIIVDRIAKLWQHRIAQAYGYTAAVSDTVANARDNGVYVLPFCQDFGPKPGWENRRQYLRTTDGMRLKMLGSIGGSGTHKMTVYTNYVGVGPGASPRRAHHLIPPALNANPLHPNASRERQR